MKRKTNKRKLSARAAKYLHKHNLAQSYYLRSTRLHLTTERCDGGIERVQAELLPSTSLPNILGFKVGTHAECTEYATQMLLLAEACGLRFSEEFIEEAEA